MLLSIQSVNSEFSFAGFYSSYTKPKPKPVGYARRKLEEEKEVKPIEIWSNSGFMVSGKHRISLQRGDKWFTTFLYN